MVKRRKKFNFQQAILSYENSVIDTENVLVNHNFVFQEDFVKNHFF